MGHESRDRFGSYWVRHKQTYLWCVPRVHSLVPRPHPTRTYIASSIARGVLKAICTGVGLGSGTGTKLYTGKFYVVNRNWNQNWNQTDPDLYTGT